MKEFKIKLYGVNFLAEFTIDDITPLVDAYEKNLNYTIINGKNRTCYHLQNLYAIEIKEVESQKVSKTSEVKE